MALWASTACTAAVLGAPAPDTAEARQHADRGLRSLQAGDLKGAEAELRRAVDLAPREATYLGSLGAVLGMEEKLEESSSFLERALRINPSDFASRRNLASNQFQLGQLQPAKANLEKILKERPTDSTSLLLLGMVDEELRDYVNAVRLLASVPDQVRERPQSIAALARAYYNIGQKDEARQTLKELGGRPAGADGIFLGGQVANQAGDYETAERMFASIRSSYPDIDKIGYQLALTQYRAGRIDESLATLRQLTDAGQDSSDIENLLGWCFFHRRDLKNTIAAMDKAVALDPGNEFNYLDVGIIMVEAQRPSGALVAAEKAIQVAPHSYRAYRLQGLAEIRLGRVTDAERAYRHALELNPADEQSILGLASVQWDDGRTREAEETFKKGFERLPREPTLYQEYGTMLLREAGRDTTTESRAVSALEKALALDASLAEPHRQLGNLALAQGRTQDALRHLELAAKLDPQSNEIHYSLGRLYQRLGRRDEASKEFQTYQRLKAEKDLGLPEKPAGGGAEPATLPAKALTPSRLSQDSAPSQQPSAGHVPR